MIMIRIILIILVVVVVVIIIIIEIPVILKCLSSFKIVICMSCYFQHQACQLLAQASHALTNQGQAAEGTLEISQDCWWCSFSNIPGT